MLLNNIVVFVHSSNKKRIMVRLTSKEEEILGYFWTKGPLFVRELLDLQEEPRPHYNTLSTIVRSLEEKGYIGYKVYGNTHQYYALVSEDDYRRNFLKQVIRAWYMDEEYMLWWFRFLNERRDGFVLLLTGAEGTAYANFQHDWVEKMTEGTWTYYAEARRRGLCTVDMTQEELHVVLSAFWTTIYEPFIHAFAWPEIQRHCTLVCRLFDWYAALGFPKG